MSVLLRGAATLFDLSGIGVFPSPVLGSLENDLEALNEDFAAISEDFREVLGAEAKRLKDTDGGQS